MKLVIGIVQPFMSREVARRLHALPSVTGATFTEARGFGRARKKETLTGEIALHDATRIRVEVVVRDEHADAVARTIREAAHTGNRGDGKVFILPVDRGLRIESDEEGEEIV